MLIIAVLCSDGAPGARGAIYDLMHKHKTKRLAAYVLSFVLAMSAVPGGFLRPAAAYAYTPQNATVKASELNVRGGPGTSYGKIASLQHGNSVTVTDEVTGADGKTWAAVNFNGGSGYVQKSFLEINASYSYDGDFENRLAAEGFPESYKERLRSVHAQYPSWVFKAQHIGISWDEVIANESVTGRNLVDKDSKSSWKSVAKGAFDWGRNYWPGFDSSAWVAASDAVIRYYMDPRNFLDTSYIFQFLQQSYDAGSQTALGVEIMAKGSFMEGTASAGSYSGNTGNPAPDAGSAPAAEGPAPDQGNSAPETSSPASWIQDGAEYAAPSQEIVNSAPEGSGAQTIGVITGAPQAKIMGGPGEEGGPGVSGGPGASGGSYSPAGNSSGTNYIDIIMNAARESGVNPYVLTAMIIQEQGRQGRSGLISGSNSSYPGIYNFFNVQAFADGSMDATTRGLWWASQSGSYGRPWDSIQKAITGGARFYGENYIQEGQDTFYLKKYNVTDKNRYQHQYMTNVDGGAAEGRILSDAYSTELRQHALVFRIPVYTGMPEQPAPAPTGDGNPNNKLSGLSVSGFTMEPAFNMDTEVYSLTVDPSVGSVNIQASAIASTTSVEGAGTVSLLSDLTEIPVLVRAENGDVRTYTIRVTRQAGGQTGGQTGGGISPGGGPGSSGSFDSQDSQGGPGASPGALSPGGSGSDGAPSGNVQLVSPSG